MTRFERVLCGYIQIAEGFITIWTLAFVCSDWSFTFSTWCESKKRVVNMNEEPTNSAISTEYD